LNRRTWGDDDDVSTNQGGDESGDGNDNSTNEGSRALLQVPERSLGRRWVAQELSPSGDVTAARRAAARGSSLGLE
jgi:hypothetical protein